MKTILITGASGTIGKNLIELLLQNNYTIHALSRKKIIHPSIKYFVWDVDTQIIEDGAFAGVTNIVHLAGEGIVDKRWTQKRKQQIIDSRVKSTELLFNYTTKNGIKLDSFICASAVGFYGADASDSEITETSPAGNDFLAYCCKQWENAAALFESICRVVKLRLAVVLAKDVGALQKLKTPAKLGLSAALGNGKQPFAWVHINDVCNVFINALQSTQMKGTYNLVAPDLQSNKSFTAALAKALNKPYFLPNVPSFIMQIALGEMSVCLLKGQKVVPQKLLAEGYSFKYNNLDKALANLV